VTKFEVTADVKMEETPDTCSSGYMTRTPGLKDAKGTMSATYDGTNPPALHEGDEILTMVLGHTVAGTVVGAFSCASAYVTSRKLNNPIPGLVTYDLEWMSNGAYSWS
jgi:hypothetical protein